MWRTWVSRQLPASFKRRVRPWVVPWLYRLERGRMRRLYANFVGQGDLAFDIGAAEGYHSDVLLSLGASVVCAEPQRECVEAIRRRLGHHPGLTIVERAVAEVEGEVDLWVCEGEPEITTLAPEPWAAGPYAGHRFRRGPRVAVTTLDALIAAHGEPVFTKIDVEGSEARVLAGLDRALPALSFELTRCLLEEAERCVARLLELGPAVFNYSLGRRFRLESVVWLSGDELLGALGALHRHAVGDVYARSAR